MEKIHIDAYLNRKEDFWSRLQYHCVLECCGLDAYEFSQKAIKENLDNYSPIEINADLDDMLLTITSSDVKYISSYVFNCYVETKEFVKIINDIKQVLLGVSV